MPGSVHIELLALVQNSINRLSAHDVLITQAYTYYVSARIQKAKMIV